MCGSYIILDLKTIVHKFNIIYMMEYVKHLENVKIQDLGETIVL
jgi:hypothetical protein